MTEDNLSSPSNAGRLNEFQARHLHVTFRYIDKLLCEIENVLNASSSRAAFPKYSPDVAPAESRRIEEHIARIRSQLVRILNEQGIASQIPYVSASRAIHAALGSIDIALEELKSRHMRGYVELPEAAANELNESVPAAAALEKGEQSAAFGCIAMWKVGGDEGRASKTVLEQGHLVQLRSRVAGFTMVVTRPLTTGFRSAAGSHSCSFSSIRLRSLTRTQVIVMLMGFASATGSFIVN